MSRLPSIVATLSITVVAALVATSVGAENRFEGLSERDFYRLQKLEIAKGLTAYMDAAVSLPNSRLRLQLYDSDPAVGRVIAEADDGSGAPFAGLGGDNKASMVRVSLDMSGILPDAWATAQEASGWDPGAEELGTPGTIPGQFLPDADSATQVTAASWGSLKAARR